jgi:hypothetical protein
MTNLVARSTRVPIAEAPSFPMIRSPSPVSGHGPISDLGRPLADHDFVGDAAAVAALIGDPMGPA